MAAGKCLSEIMSDVKKFQKLLVLRNCLSSINMYHEEITKIICEKGKERLSDQDVKHLKRLIGKWKSKVKLFEETLKKSDEWLVD